MNPFFFSIQIPTDPEPVQLFGFVWMMHDGSLDASAHVVLHFSAPHLHLRFLAQGRMAYAFDMRTDDDVFEEMSRVQIIGANGSHSTLPARQHSSYVAHIPRGGWAQASVRWRACGDAGGASGVSADDGWLELHGAVVRLPGEADGESAELFTLRLQERPGAACPTRQERARRTASERALWAAERWAPGHSLSGTPAGSNATRALGRASRAGLDTLPPGARVLRVSVNRLSSSLRNDAGTGEDKAANAVAMLAGIRMRRPGLSGRDGERSRRRAQLESDGTPYPRLAGCPAPAEHVTLGLGLLLDAGFVGARGGREAALLAAVGAVSRANLLLSPQLGVRFVLRRVLLNEAAGGVFEFSGPNETPSGGRGTRTCPGYQRTTLTNGGSPVLIEGPQRAVNALHKWVGTYGDAPAAVGAWVLLTDCFPPPGATGLAAVGQACTPPTEAVYTDSGRDGVAGECALMADSGNCAEAATSGVSPCTAGSEVCAGNGAVVNDGPDMWRTLAHELSHLLGGYHTFNEGGLMAYTSELQLHDNGDICPKISQIRAAPSSCFGSAVAVCGNGLVEVGEECDDGGQFGGDGCDAACAIECGWRCASGVSTAGAVAPSVETPSVCTVGCGNGVVEPELGEECDSPDACCDGCRLARGAVCCGGECCDAAGQQRPTTTACAGGKGHCEAVGRPAPHISRHAYPRLYLHPLAPSPPTSKPLPTNNQTPYPQTTCQPATSPAYLIPPHTHARSGWLQDGRAFLCRLS